VDCLYFARDLLDHGTTQSQFPTQPVNVLPLQSNQLRPTQTLTDAHNRHRSVWLSEHFAQKMKLFQPHRACLPSGLGHILDPYKLHGLRSTGINSAHIAYSKITDSIMRMLLLLFGARLRPDSQSSTARALISGKGICPHLGKM
jgi:hypothetical protein